MSFVDPDALIDTLYQQAQRLHKNARCAEAELWCRQGLYLAEKHLSTARPVYINLNILLGMILESQSRFDDAADCFRHSAELLQSQR